MPRKFNKEELQKIEELAWDNTTKEIAEYFNLTINNFKYLKSKYPEVKEALIRGITYGDNSSRRRVYKKKVHVFTSEELIKIEELAINCNYKEMSEKLGIPEHKFRSLRKNDAELRAAIERGVQKRNNNFVEHQKVRRSEQIKKGKVGADINQGGSVEYDEFIALRRFKEQFEANKLKQSIRELKEIDLI